MRAFDGDRTKIVIRAAGVDSSANPEGGLANPASNWQAGRGTRSGSSCIPIAVAPMADTLSKPILSDPANGGVSILRLHLLRIVFAGTFLFVGTNAWRAILTHSGPWDPLHGVAFSFWAAYSLLMLLGLRYPLKLVPLLLLQFFYKLVWLAAVGYPLWSSNQLSGSAARMATIFIIAAVVDLAVVPWPYALRNYLLGPRTDDSRSSQASPADIP